ncbi:MAG: hypothetical protein ACOCZ8_00050 [Bacteroidota bacterium]
MRWWWSSVVLVLFFACSNEVPVEVAAYTPMTAADSLFFARPSRVEYMTNVGQKFSIQKECPANARWMLLPFESSSLALEREKMRTLNGGRTRRYYFFLKPLQPGRVTLRFRYKAPDSTHVVQETVEIAR